MRICPKCGSRHVSGPTYVGATAWANRTGREALRYRCLTCGYTKDEPTLDGGER